MIRSNTFDKEEIRQEKKRFWINWVISNAGGMSIGWCLGEYIGQLVLDEYGLKAGMIAAVVIFELSIWLARLLPSQYFSKQHPLKFLDVVIWLSTEIVGWIIFSFVESSSTNLTAEVIFLFSMGVVMWITYAAFRLLKNEKNRNPPDWFSKAFMYVLLGFGFGNMFVVFLMTTAMSINFSLAKMFNPYVGWGSAGLFLGGTLGAVTGLILVKSINWERCHE